MHRLEPKGAPRRRKATLALAMAAALVTATALTLPWAPWAMTTAKADFYDGLVAYEGHDFAAAVRELEPLARQGDARAQRLVGLLYRDGRGVPQDFVRAHQWLNLSAAAGDTEAVSLRDELARRMDPGQVAEAQRLAAAWRPESAAAPTAAPIASTAGVNGALPVASAVGATSLNRVQTMDLQWQLAVHGYDPGAADGVVGPRTWAAIRAYQADAGLPADGVPTIALLDHVRLTDPPVRNARAVADYGWASLPVVQPAVAQPARATTSMPASPTADGGAWSRPVAVPLATIYTVAVQQALSAGGYRPGPIDGVAGPRTTTAIRRYQGEHGLPVTGIVSQALVNHLRLIAGQTASYGGAS
ncbi:MAG: peptidoglycan-binding protein [Alphaproteobacteria bacterium]